jgi:hypothetical protein
MMVRVFSWLLGAAGWALARLTPGQKETIAGDLRSFAMKLLVHLGQSHPALLPFAGLFPTAQQDDREPPRRHL